MAYFSNGSEGMCFDDQCSKCKYGMQPCPIAYVQGSFNYDQHKDPSGTAKKILDALVKEDGTCTMFETFRKDLEGAETSLNGSLFPELIPPIKNKEK